MYPKSLASRLAPAVALTAVAALAACSKPEPAPEPVRAVRTVTVSTQSAGGTQEFAAEVRARTESRLAFRVGGKITARPAEVGQHVKAGQLLAQLDAEDMRQGQESARAALGAAQSNFDFVAGEYRRFKDLRDQGFISDWELERRSTALKAAQAQLDQARAQAAMQRNQTAYTSLAATAAGTVTAVDAEVGTVVAAGAPVLRLAHDGPRDAVFSVPEDAAGAFRLLLGKRGAVQVRLWGRADSAPATLREVAAAADPATRTFLVKADLGDLAVQLGQTASVLVAGPRAEAVVKLPLTAVTRSQGKTAVWIVDKATMTVRLQPIAVGGADGNLVVVTDGLVAGQEVVTAGVHVLSPAQKVKFYQPASAGR